MALTGEGADTQVNGVMFTEGKTFVDIEFESAAGDPLPPDFILDVARKQDAAIKAGLPG